VLESIDGLSCRKNYVFKPDQHIIT
jgi:hypothetical protein